MAGRSLAKKTTPNEAANQSANNQPCSPQRIGAAGVSEALAWVTELLLIRSKADCYRSLPARG